VETIILNGIISLMTRRHENKRAVVALQRILRNEIRYNLDIIGTFKTSNTTSESPDVAMLRVRWVIEHLSVEVIAQLFVDSSIGSELISSISEKGKIETITAEDGEPVRKAGETSEQSMAGEDLLGFLLKKIRVLKALTTMDDTNALLERIDWDRRLSNLTESFLILNNTLK
jgi:hypothetical protein